MTKNSLFFNGCFDKNRIKSLISWSLRHCGEKITIDLVENLKTLGFTYATEAGISLGIDDLKIPPIKANLILEADIKIKQAQVNYKKGYLTGIEKFQQSIDTWHRTSEILKQNVIQYFRSTDILNPVYMMAFSGARGNVSQVRQLVGMRGLMSDPQGQILDFPIKSNFREGLTLTEYIISCYGARKGLVDTALKTANSGYLTRRLVDVSHHIIISDFDCQTQHGIVLNNITENKKIIVPLQKRLIGRILAKNVYSKNKTTRVVASPISLGNVSTPNITTKISNVSKMKQKLAFTKPLLNTNSRTRSVQVDKLQSSLSTLQNKKSEILFPIKKIPNYSYVNFKRKNNNGRALALFSKLLLYSLSKTNSNNKSTKEIFVVKTESLQTVSQFENLNTSCFQDFYWQQLVFSLSHVIFSFSNQTLIASKNQEISASLAVKIATLKKRVLVRSPLTCEIENSLCQLCYGWSLAHGKLVSLGEAVGIIAAQSIGEPGTQLTMRTFHTGGVFSGDIMSEITAPFNGIVEFAEFFQGILIRTPHGKIAFLTKVPGNFQIICKQNTQFNLPEKNKLSTSEITTKHHEKIKPLKNVTFEIPAFTVLFVRNKEHVIKRQLIAEFSSISANRNEQIKANYNLTAELEGEVHFDKMIRVTFTEKKKIVSELTYNLGSIWIFSAQIYQQPVSFTLFPQYGDLLNLNSIMGQYSSMSLYDGVLNILPNASNEIIFQTNNKVSKYLKIKQNEKFVSDPQSTWGLLSKKAGTTSPQVENRKNYNTLQNKKAKIEPFKKKSTSFLPALQSKASSNNKMNSLSNNTFFLNHTLISFSIKCIQYKKIGYFLSFSNAQSLISLDSFFLSNSLKQNFKNYTKLKKNFYFQSFPKQYQTKTGGILICDNFYRNEKLGSGEVFWISEETYTISSCNFIYFHFKSHLSIKNQDGYLNAKVKSSLQTNYKKWINKNNSLIFYTNSQGKISSLCSKLHGYIQSDFSLFLFNNKKKQFNAGSCWQPRVKTQRKKLQVSLVAQKKANKTQNTFFANNFFDNQSFYKKTLGSTLSKSNLENQKSNTLIFRLNPLAVLKSFPLAALKSVSLSFYNAKYKKLYFVLFKTTRSCILKPKFAWEINKQQCDVTTKSHYSENEVLRSLSTLSINLLKIKTFNTQPNKYKNSKFPLLDENSLAQLKDLSENSQNFFQRKKLCVLNKKNKLKFKIKPGWVYFPTNIKKTILKQKSVVQPGVVCFDDILFDQYSVYFECFSFNTFYNENLSETDNLQFQTKVEKNTSLKYNLNLQYICNEFNLSKNNKVFSNAILTKPNIYSFFANIHSSKFFNKNFSTFISKFFSYTKKPSFINEIYKTSNRKKILRNKKFLLNHFVKKNVFSSFARNIFDIFKQSNERKHVFYDKIYFLQICNFPRNKSKEKSLAQLKDRTVLNNVVLPILMPSVALLENIEDISSKGKNNFSFQLIIKPIPEFNEKQFTRIKTQFIPKFFVLIRKIHSYSFISSVKYKTLLSQQNQNKLYSLVTQNKKNESQIHFIYFSWFNQQKITDLFFHFLSPDFSIKPYFPYKGYRKSIFLKNTIILKFFILFIIPKHYASNIVEIKFIAKTENNKLKCQSPPFLYTTNSRFKKNSDFLINQRNKLIFNLSWYLNFSILRELKFSNQLRDTKFNTKGEKSTVLVYSKNAISPETPISFTTFFSPFQGEIVRREVEVELRERVNENYLILTNKDQVTFSLETMNSNNKKIGVASLNTLSPNFLGEFIDYGTKIENLAIPESGEIIQIHKSKIVVRKVQSILFSRKGLLSVYSGDIIEKNSLVLSLFYQRLKTGDIVQGIPKIEQLFEARKTNQGEILAGSLHEQLEFIFKSYKRKYNPEIAASLSLTKIQQIIVNNVQQVYQSQGVTIAEKHLEIIVRQMTSKVEITRSGPCGLLPGEIVDLDWMKLVTNAETKTETKEKTQYKPVILGITRKSLETKSFISEASFQETTRILTRAAVERKTDFLKGLKENVILGHVIPAGTGFFPQFELEGILKGEKFQGDIFNRNRSSFFHENKSFDVFQDIFPKIST